MAAGGAKNSTGKSTTSNKKHHRLQNLTEIISIVSSAASAVRTFHSDNDLHLLPSQSLSLESSLHSLSKLISLLKPSPSPPVNSVTSPPPWFPKFLSSPSQNWTETVRMSKPTFTLLLRFLTPSLNSLSPIPPNYALAATLFRLAHSASYSSVAARFGFNSASTACHVFFVVIKAINDNIAHLFELRSDVSRILTGFNWMCLPNCCGVLGFHRFRVSGNLLGQNGSILVQALVDSEGRFLDVSAGWPSTMSPDTIFRQTELFSGVEESRELLNGPAFNLGESNSIPQYILGESCLPHLPWILTPYNEKINLESHEQSFNFVHYRGMELVESAFGRIRTQWRLLSREWNEECIEYLPYIVVTCCLLHNFLIKCSEPKPDNKDVGFLRADDDDDDNDDDDGLPCFKGEIDERAWRIRNALASYINRVSKWR